MEVILAYGAGVLTLINPCVLPVLPIVLAGALQASRWGPVFLAAGLSLSFVALGLFVTAAGREFGLNEDNVARGGAYLMIGFGVIMLLPIASRAFATATSGLAARADAGIDKLDRSSLVGQFLGGMLLGAVWSPCIGPTLGAAISLASQGESLFKAGLIMTGFATGVSTIILVLSYAARGLLARNRALMMALATRARPILGIVFIAVGCAILFRLHHMIEAWAIQNLPPWLIDLSVYL